jgi:phospholipid/cholesterol/gamma-HCH transport system ATP-binding protein
MKEELGVTSIVVTHDIKSAFHIADRIGVHWKGRLVETGTPEQIRGSEDPFVRQFLSGSLEGPMVINRV